MSRGRDVMADMDRTVRAIGARYEKRHGERPPGACCYEAVDFDTPAAALVRKESALTPSEALELHAGEVDGEGPEAVRLMLEVHFWLLDFLFAEGPHPGRVMRRLYAWVKKYRPSAIWDAGYRQLGELLGESHAAMEWRIGKLLDDYAESKGLKGVKMPWQRGADVSAKLSAAQQGNVNRLGGRKCRKEKKRQKTNQP